MSSSEHNEMKCTEAKMSQTRSTYRAVQAVSPGKLEPTEKPLLDPPPGHVRIRVEACGVCHSDAGTVEGVSPSNGRVCPATRRSVGSMRSLKASKAGSRPARRHGVSRR